MTKVLLTNLYAVRGLIDAAILEQETALGLHDPPPTNEGCPHRRDRQRDATTMGGSPKLLCLDCGQTHVGTLEK